MPKPPARLYRYHVANLRSLEGGLKQTARLARESIGQGQEQVTKPLVRLYALLLGAWAETRLQKLLYEKAAFSEAERKAILSQKQLERWRSAVVCAFRKQYLIPNADLSTALPHSARARYLTLLDALESDLRSVIELRNKLAHGQWVYPLNTDGNDIAQVQMNALRLENLLSLQHKWRLLRHLANGVHDVAVSKPTFERDFDKNFSLLEGARTDLRTRSYDKYKAGLRAKRAEGKERRRQRGKKQG